MDGQEILWCPYLRLFNVHGHPHPKRDESDGLQHSAATRKEDGDPGEQRHSQPGEEPREVRAMRRSTEVSGETRHDTDKTAAFSCLTDKRTMKCAIGNWKKGTCSLVRSRFIDLSHSNSSFLMKA